MTYTRMVEAIASRTGVPKSVVRHVLDAQMDVIKMALTSRDEVHFPGLMKITSAIRKVTYPNHVAKDKYGDAITEPVTLERVTLRIRPMKAFREELNRWTSTGF